MAQDHRRGDAGPAGRARRARGAGGRGLRAGRHPRHRAAAGLRARRLRRRVGRAGPGALGARPPPAAARAAGASPARAALAGWRGFVGRANGGMVVHIGVVVIAIGLAAATSFLHRGDLHLPRARPATFAGHTVAFVGTRAVTSPSHSSFEAVLRVDGGGRVLPGHQPVRGGTQAVGTPAIDSSWRDDLYLTIDSIPGGTPGRAEHGLDLRRGRAAAGHVAVDRGPVWSGSVRSCRPSPDGGVGPPTRCPPRSREPRRHPVRTSSPTSTSTRSVGPSGGRLPIGAGETAVTDTAVSEAAPAPVGTTGRPGPAHRPVGGHRRPGHRRRTDRRAGHPAAGRGGRGAEPGGRADGPAAISGRRSTAHLHPARVPRQVRGGQLLRQLVRTVPDRGPRAGARSSSNTSRRGDAQWSASCSATRTATPGPPRRSSARPGPPWPTAGGPSPSTSASGTALDVPDRSRRPGGGLHRLPGDRGRPRPAHRQGQGRPRVSVPALPAVDAARRRAGGGPARRERGPLVVAPDRGPAGRGHRVGHPVPELRGPVGGRIERADRGDRAGDGRPADRRGADRPADRGLPGRPLRLVHRARSADQRVVAAGLVAAHRRRRWPRWPSWSACWSAAARSGGRRPSTPTSGARPLDPVALEERRQFLTQSLADADAEYLAGDLSDADYLALRQRDLARLALLGPVATTADGVRRGPVAGHGHRDAHGRPGGCLARSGTRAVGTADPAATTGRRGRNRWFLIGAVACFAGGADRRRCPCSRPTGFPGSRPPDR